MIFRASLAEIDEEYHRTAARMRELALSKYGCMDFVSLTENNQELSISYWNDEAQIVKWKNDSKHVMAQEAGRNKWYRAYRVEVVKVVRDYGGSRTLSDSGSD